MGDIVMLLTSNVIESAVLFKSLSHVLNMFRNPAGHRQVHVPIVMLGMEEASLKVSGTTVLHCCLEMLVQHG